MWAQEVYGLDDRDDTVAAGGGNSSKGSTVPGVTSHLVQPPAYFGAGGPVRNSEAGRGEPETLESVLAAVGGATWAI